MLETLIYHDPAGWALVATGEGELEIRDLAAGASWPGAVARVVEAGESLRVDTADAGSVRYRDLALRPLRVRGVTLQLADDPLTGQWYRSELVIVEERAPYSA